MGSMKLCISSNGEKMYMKSKDVILKEMGELTIIDHTCPLSGRTFKTRKEYWKYIVISKLDPVNMNYDRYVSEENDSDSLEKLMDKSHLPYLIESGYIGKDKTNKLKISKKNLENLLGSINLELYISAIKIFRKEFIIDDEVTGEVTEEVAGEGAEEVTEEVAEEVVEVVEEVKTNDKCMKYIDLFCGIGGFHQALKRLGCKCVLACDIDKACRANYKLNYGIEPHPDIKKLQPSDIEGDIDIIVGGFPCQAFSGAGNKKMFDDERGLLFDEIIRLAKVKRPTFMFLENVKHILKVGEGKVIEYIKQKLSDNGYHLQLFEISPHHYGVPQQRDRVYFVCIDKSFYNGEDIVLPPKIEDFKFESFLDKKEDIDKKYFIDGDTLKCLNAWEEMIKIFPPGEKISPVIMINEHYNNHTQEVFDNYAGWRKGYITANKPLIQKYKPQWDAWYEKHKDILQKREIYGKLEWQAGKIKENDSIWNYFIQIRQSGIRVKRAHHFPTLVAISQIPIYGKEKRYITPRECARLQSFPEDFKIDELDKNSYKQFGNAVNVDNVHTVIKATFDHYGL
jgi:DNA (cytosine-5)-methyltransferase 1